MGCYIEVVGDDGMQNLTTIHSFSFWEYGVGFEIATFVLAVGSQAIIQLKDG